jgi:hypothetical protein
MEALLNDEGKKHWGEIFPNGEVPVKTIVPQDAEIEGKNQPLKVYLVNLGYPHKKTARRYPAETQRQIQRAKRRHQSRHPQKRASASKQIRRLCKHPRERFFY